jgi:hypothetical protein
LAALASDGAVADLIEPAANESEQAHAVRFSLLPDAARDWVVATEAAPEVADAAVARYLRQAATSIEQWAGGCRRALVRLAPTIT